MNDRNRMTDGEVSAHMEAIRQEVRAGFMDLRNDIIGLTSQVHTTNSRMRDVELQQAEQRGSNNTIRWMVGLGLAVPSAMAAIVGTVGALKALGVW